MSSSAVRISPLSEISPFMLECMKDGLAVTIAVNGRSMTPLLRDKRDAAVLQKPLEDAPLNVGDVPLYLRDSGQYVLHRVVSVQPDGCYTMMGDNQTVREPGIRHDQILAVAAAFYRGKKIISADSSGYKRYVWMWLHCPPCRYLWVFASRIIGKIKFRPE